jgi:hypothetical protein
MLKKNLAARRRAIVKKRNLAVRETIAVKDVVNIANNTVGRIVLMQLTNAVPAEKRVFFCSKTSTKLAWASCF